MANEIDLRYANLLLKKATKVNGCLICHLSNASGGYCKVVGGGWAHRFIYETLKGPIPSGHLVMHTCDTRPCIDLDHLITGTHHDNMLDMIAKDRQVVGVHSTKSNDALKIVDKAMFDRILYLKDLGISQRRIGSELGISQYVVMKCVNGQYSPL